jgi:hypothetical protein
MHAYYNISSGHSINVIMEITKLCWTDCERDVVYSCKSCTCIRLIKRTCTGFYHVGLYRQHGLEKYEQHVTRHPADQNEAVRNGSRRYPPRTAICLLHLYTLKRPSRFRNSSLIISLFQWPTAKVTSSSDFQDRHNGQSITYYNGLHPSHRPIDISKKFAICGRCPLRSHDDLTQCKLRAKYPLTATNLPMIWPVTSSHEVFHALPLVIPRRVPQCSAVVRLLTNSSTRQRNKEDNK